MENKKLTKFSEQNIGIYNTITYNKSQVLLDIHSI